VALKGFHLLFTMFGYFEVEETMFHITNDNKVKVWCSWDISQTKPKEPKAQGTIKDMVTKVLTIISDNTDRGNCFPLGNII
jgi:hypothetical protein